MPEQFRALFTEPAATPLVVLARLVGAMLLGGAVAFVYSRARGNGDTSSSFSVTLVLLSILIAMVTQVIGDNVARAFSLVGALSIVRFRTVVRDTQDTAFVIFAVAVGMAVGAGHPTVALSGIGIVGLAAWFMNRRQPAVEPHGPYELEVRVALGPDPEGLLRETLDAHARGRRLTSMATARQGMAIEVAYRLYLRSEAAAGELVRGLNRLEGVQSVALRRSGGDEEQG
jgi:uncharacterized membrane protein YhiD involved in acid resistance